MNNQKEIWKDVVGYEGYYQVSNLGRVKSILRKDYGIRNVKEKIKKPSKLPNGYMRVCLYKHNKSKTAMIHRLIGEAFINNPENKRTINHKNGIKHDNRIENLEWATDSENNIHALEIGLRKAKNIIQYDLNGNYINNYYSILFASSKTNESRYHIKRSLNEEIHNKYIWKYA